MNEIQITIFRNLIMSRLDEIEAEDELGKGSQAVVTLDQQSVGRLSRMDALQSQAMAKAQQSRRDVQKKRLHSALERMAEGEFGHCEDCGEGISEKRLELDPAASKCISCAAG